MIARENILRALRRDNPEYVPFFFSLCPAQEERFAKLTGTRDYASYYDFPIREVTYKETRQSIDFKPFYRKLPKDARPLDWNSEWGPYGVPGSLEHFLEILSPMTYFETIDEINMYPYPDLLEDYRWEGIETQVKMIIDSGYAAIAHMQMTVFETAWHMRGMENLLVDMVLAPEMAEALLDKITDIRVGMAARFAGGGVDILTLGDDVSTQIDMMMSPAVWRMMLKPRMAKIIKAAKDVKPNLLVYYHGDGNLQTIIPDLIEIGIDILNPIQPECMDPLEIKRLYGDQLSFWGLIGTQSTLPFGTVADVQETCKKYINNVGKGGGLVLAPTHIVEPEVPWENIIAFIQTVKEYGRY